MNNFNEHEIIVQHKNFFGPTRAGFPNLFLAMYPFSVLTDEYVPINFLMTKYFITLNSFASSCFRGFLKKNA